MPPSLFKSSRPKAARHLPLTGSSYAGGQAGPENLSNQSGFCSAVTFSLRQTPLPSLSPFCTFCSIAENHTVICLLVYNVVPGEQERDPNSQALPSEPPTCLAGTTTQIQGHQDFISCFMGASGLGTGDHIQGTVGAKQHRPVGPHPWHGPQSVFNISMISALCHIH